MTHIAENLALITAKIEETCQKNGRPPAAVTLVAVSKTHPIEAVEAALAAGQRMFGENRVQEAATKFAPLKSRFPDLELHLIGPLQTNKVHEAIRLFDVIETLDRPKLADALATEMKKQERFPRLYIEVNIAAEPQKAGVLPENLDAFIALCRELGLKIDGLMCLPPVDQDPAPHFAQLRLMATRLGLAELSMGMSADFEEAIAAGATHVRVGTAIFGDRDKPR
ncbi:MAG TPA: YggS family pyridoxal phosphate-dependent enzyme [Rhodospirillaceae bacterium]|nr:YggS family pyridoxal phosphate-dependent enzyme [Rhodospirillaceae bacterium]